MMTQPRRFHVLTIGSDRTLNEKLWRPIEVSGSTRFSHLMHPRMVASDHPELSAEHGYRFFRTHVREQMPEPDPELLASLEQEGVPTIHNMIMGDRIVSKLAYRDALRYATFIARRLIELLEELQPTVVIGGYDALHGGIGLAVARRMNVPWFALHFSVIPPGLACFCDRMSPASRVLLEAARLRPRDELRSFADGALRKFENRSIQAPAYIAPPRPPLGRKLAALPARLAGALRTWRKRRDREFLQFTEDRAGHNISAALARRRRQACAYGAIERVHALNAPPDEPYVFFGLHFQPESSIDVWAPFFSNQMWTIELLSRSIPPSHKLLVKIHKSDAAHYSKEQLQRIGSFPGVQLVRPFADTRSFIEKADLVFSIQGTIGLEAALLGKPVITLGDSPIVVFPSVVRIGAIVDLPELVRSQLSAPVPERERILSAYVSFLAPFFPAAHNDWSVAKSAAEIGGFVRLFQALEQHLSTREPVLRQRSR